MFQNVSRKRTPKGKSKSRRRSRSRAAVGTVDGAPMNPDLRRRFEAEGLLPPTEPTGAVRVELDNTIPEGFRMVPCP